MSPLRFKVRKDGRLIGATKDPMDAVMVSFRNIGSTITFNGRIVFKRDRDWAKNGGTYYAAVDQIQETIAKHVAEYCAKYPLTGGADNA